jgi:hypothetical protein
LTTPLEVDDRPAFQSWCRIARTVRHEGEISLLGLRPLLKAELQWGLHSHAQRKDGAHWPLGWIRAFGHYCRTHDLGCLDEVDLADCSHTDRMITQEILGELRRVYFSPADSRESGFIDTERRKLSGTASYFDLTGVEVRWLRDLLWDHMAARLSSAQCPRSRKVFDGLRHGALALSAFLVLDAPAEGQNSRLLHAEHMQRFVADIRHREREQLPQLGWIRTDRPPSVVTEHTRRDIFTVQAISRRADVSRAFLYQNPKARALVTEVLTKAGTQRQHAVQAADQAAELAWRERALNAEDGLKTAHGEIRTQRTHLGELLGRVRDLEVDLPQDAVQRLATENTTLKQQNRTLTSELKTVTDRLAAARGNNRSLERQVAELQAELLDPTNARHLRPIRPCAESNV